MSYNFKSVIAEVIFKKMVTTAFKDDYRAVLNLADQVISIEPDITSPAFYCMIGDAYFCLQDYYEAKKALLKSVEYDSKYKEYRSNPGIGAIALGQLGLIYLMENNPQKSVSYLEKASEYSNKISSHDPKNQYAEVIKRGLNMAKERLR